MLESYLRNRLKEKDILLMTHIVLGYPTFEDSFKIIAAMVEAGVDFLGFVFYPKSPRYVTQEQARRIHEDLPSRVSTVGVFVNEGFSQIMRKVEACGLKAVQLHGTEPPELVERLMGEQIKVIKAVFVNGLPALASAESYPASALLVEAARGILPGGNALSWNWN